MVFGIKPVIFDKGFSSSDLLQYIELLIKEARMAQRRNDENHYAWLKSREMEIIDLDRYENIVKKLSPEHCAAIVVKLDTLVDQTNMAECDITSEIQKLLEEQQNIQQMEENIKSYKMKRFNKVYPELVNGRRPSVSFIIDRILSIL